MSEPPISVMAVVGSDRADASARALARHPRFDLRAIAGLPGSSATALAAALAAELDVEHVADPSAGFDLVSTISVGDGPAMLAAGIAALTAGRHVWLDQLTTNQATELAPFAAVGAGQVVAVNSGVYAAGVQAARRTVDAGTIGLPWGVHLSSLTALSPPESPGCPPRSDPAADAARLLVDAVAVTEYLTGLLVERVHAVRAGSPVLHPAGGAFGGVVTMDLQRGGRAVSVSAAVPMPPDQAGPECLLRLRGSRGSMVGPIDAPRLWVRTATGSARRPFGADSGDPAIDGPTDRALHTFADTIVGGRSTYTVQNAMHAVAVLAAAQRSMATGEVVDVEPEPKACPS